MEPPINKSPEQIISDANANIEIEPDVLTLDRIEETMRDIRNVRENQISELQASNLENQRIVATLQREIAQLGTVKEQNAVLVEALGGYTLVAQNDNIFKLLSRKSVELDALQVSIAKTLNDLESSINSLKLNKSNLTQEHMLQRERVRKLLTDPQGPDGLLDQDANVLKINLYRNLGVRIESEEGKDDQILVQDNDKTSVLKVEKKYSEYFVSNYVWDRLAHD